MCYTLRRQSQPQKKLGSCQPEILRRALCVLLISLVFCTCEVSGFVILMEVIKWISLPVLLREAISRVCEAVPGAKGAFRKRKVLSFWLCVCLLLFFSSDITQQL